jgi:hypothetical protein
VIYFAQIGETGPIKIGTTIQLVRRLLQLKATKGGRLRILAIADGGRDMEIHFHKTFRHLHIKGEWFRPGEDLLGHIALYRRDNERAGIFTGTPVTFVRRKVEGVSRWMLADDKSGPLPVTPVPEDNWHQAGEVLPEP